MEISELLALIFGVLTGIMAVVALFQTRIGKMQSALKDDMQAMESRVLWEMMMGTLIAAFFHGEGPPASA